MAAALPRDTRMMHARSILLGNSYHATAASVNAALLLWKLPKSWDIFSAHCRTPSVKRNNHWPWEISIGCFQVYRPHILSRSALNTANRPQIPTGTCSWKQQRAKQYMAWNFELMWAWSLSQSCKRLKGAWPSTLGPSIIHLDVWWPKEPRLQFNVKCMQTKTREYQHPIMLESRGLATEGWGVFCHLKYKHSSIPMPGLTPQTKQCNACYANMARKCNILLKCKACQM